jgi:hypothetical protein
MLRGWRRFGALVGLGLIGCSGVNGGEAPVALHAGIVGGQNDTTHKGVFGIVIQNMALCSGSLIAPNLILTARHCVAELSTGDGDVDCTNSTFSEPFAPGGFDLTWTQNLNGTVSPSSLYGATEVRVPTDDHVCGNDVALIFLDQNVPPTDAATIEPRVDEAPVTNETFEAVGYGLNSASDATGTSAGVRRQAGGNNVACVGAVECLGTRARNNEWAAYVPICHGDSGGPALDEEGRAIGVASRADVDCVLGLYGSVAAWKSFIVEGAVDAATQGGYDPPAWTGEPAPGTGGSGATGGSAGTGAAGAGGTSNGGSGGMSASSAGRSMTGSAGQAPTPDAGTPLPDAGNAGTGGTGMSVRPALGEDCTDGCAEGLACYTTGNKAPGECVPWCSSAYPTCPSKYECDQSINACVRKQASDSDVTHSSGCGCRIGDSRAAGAPWQIVGLFAALGAALRRRGRHRS